MNITRSLAAVPALLVLGGSSVAGQTPSISTDLEDRAETPVLETEAERLWTYSASVYTYVVPDDSSYAQPTVTVDRDWLHLEARYNYEALQTGSAWIGYNFSGGQKLEWEFTPMVGGVFGEIDGIAPGFHGSLSWWKLELYSEGEYVFDLGEDGESFFYSWTELSLAPVDWFRFGLVSQRTRVYESEREVQRGILAGFSYKFISLTTYLFNLDDRPMTVVVALSASF